MDRNKITGEGVIRKLDHTDKGIIATIATWYLDEWSIPIASTTHRLTNQPSDDNLFQLILNKDNKPMATGGLYNHVGLHNEHPRFKKFKPWVALLYTVRENRNQGLGQILLNEIEAASKEMGLNRIYLFTFTAEALYLRSGWTQIERVIYKGYDTVIMEKRI